MDFFKQQKHYRPNKKTLLHFIKTFWFIPSDVLQRSMEASIWDLCTFKTPILDIGIGNGKLTNFLFKKHPQIDVGIDIEESGLDMARDLEMTKGKKRYKKVFLGNAERMIFKDNSFNTVISNSTFEHIINDAKAVGEVGRVLKKGGLFFLTVPSEHLREWILEYEQSKNEKTAKEKLELFNQRTQHFHYRSLSMWEKNLNKSGMKLVFYKYYFPKSVALYWYKIFKIFTKKVNNREVWSYIGHSKITQVLPQKLLMRILEKNLQLHFEKGFFTDTDKGAQLFLVAKKV